MFSIGKYSRQKFSLGGSDMTVDIRAYAYEDLQVSIGFGQNISIVFSGMDQLVASAVLTIGFPETVFGEEALRGKVDLKIGIPISGAAEERVNMAAYAGVDLYANALATENLIGKAYIGEDLHQREMNFTGCLNGLAQIGKNIYTERGLFSEVLLGRVTSTTIETDICNITLQIPPGGVLEIDSNTFVAYLDNNSALHLQSGEWVFVNPETLSVTLSTGNGAALSGTMMYIEKFL